MDREVSSRMPLHEIQNVQQDGFVAAVKKPATGRLKPAISKKASALPQPSTRRQTMSRARPTNREAQPSAPSRLAAKPSRGAQVGLHNTTRSSSNHTTNESRRRSTATMAFTPASTTTSSGLMPGRRRHANAHDSSPAIPTVMENGESGSQGPFPEGMRTCIEEVITKFTSSQSDRDSKILKMSEDCSHLKSRLLASQESLHKTKSALVEETARTKLLDKQVLLLQKRLEASDMDREGHSKTSKEIEALNMKLVDSQQQQEQHLSKVRCLETEVREKETEIILLESNAKKFSSKLEASLRRAEDIENDLMAREADLRQVVREKDSLKLETRELMDKLEKGDKSLKEARSFSGSLQAKIEDLVTENDKMKLVASNQLNTYKTDVTAKLESLEKEKTVLTQSNDALKAELALRNREIESSKEAISLQEGMVSQLSKQKMNQNLQIETMQTEIATANAQIVELLKTVQDQKEQLMMLEEQARQDEAVRRKLHNAVQELKGNIRVFCRVRPLLTKEIESADMSLTREMFQYNEKGLGIVARPPPREGKTGPSSSSPTVYPFKFDRVFDPQSKQETVFEEISQLVQSALDGYRVCIFAYGQTGSGKTHTMLGRRGDEGRHLGMIPRTVRQVFESAKVLEKDSWAFNLKASFLEIYNETIRDLLIDSTNGKQKAKEEYKISFSSETGLNIVSDLTVKDVQDEEQLQQLINYSMKNRATAATKANERSSRSHSVFRLLIEGRNSSTGQALSGVLNLIDLAGSERLNQSKAEGDRLRETRHINKSLSALGDVIAALSNNDKHVPYRNSKLTYLLQDSLGGDSKTLMFVNVSQTQESFSESLCSLRFAAKVNSCHVGTARRSAKIEF